MVPVRRRPQCEGPHSGRGFFRAGRSCLDEREGEPAGLSAPVRFRAGGRAAGMNRRSICVAMSVRKRTVNGQWGGGMHDSSRHRAAAPTRHRVEAGRSPGWGYQRRPSCHSLTSLILRLLRRVPARPSAVRAANRCGSSASSPTCATPISTSAITFASAARATTSSWLDRSRGPHGDQSRECLAGGCPIRAASAARGDAERARFLQQSAGRVDRARERVCAAGRRCGDDGRNRQTCTNSAARKPEHSRP